MIHERRLFTKISSNLSIANKELLTEVCRAGLDYLTVSVGGTSQEVYERYHRGGTLETVLNNIRHVAAYKRKYNSKTPLIEFKYLLFKHNLNEMETARAMAYGLGADIFKCHTGGGPDEATIADADAIRKSPGTQILPSPLEYDRGKFRRRHRTVLFFIF